MTPVMRGHNLHLSRPSSSPFATFFQYFLSIPCDDISAECGPSYSASHYVRALSALRLEIDLTHPGAGITNQAQQATRRIVPFVM
jgi:hypothetical protein